MREDRVIALPATSASCADRWSIHGPLFGGERRILPSKRRSSFRGALEASKISRVKASSSVAIAGLIATAFGLMAAQAQVAPMTTPKPLTTPKIPPIITPITGYVPPVKLQAPCMASWIFTPTHFLISASVAS
jgi:hypothetical protein